MYYSKKEIKCKREEERRIVGGREEDAINIVSATRSWRRKKSQEAKSRGYKEKDRLPAHASAGSFAWETSEKYLLLICSISSLILGLYKIIITNTWGNFN